MDDHHLFTPQWDTIEKLERSAFWKGWVCGALGATIALLWVL